MGYGDFIPSPSFTHIVTADVARDVATSTFTFNEHYNVRDDISTLNISKILTTTIGNTANAVTPSLHPPPSHCNNSNVHGKHTGCLDLLEKVEEIKPIYHIFGHVHESYGVSSNGVTTFINASTCNSDYDPINKPVVFDIPVRAKKKSKFLTYLEKFSMSSRIILNNMNSSSISSKNISRSSSLRKKMRSQVWKEVSINKKGSMSIANLFSIDSEDGTNASSYKSSFTSFPKVSEKVSSTSCISVFPTLSSMQSTATTSNAPCKAALRFSSLKLDKQISSLSIKSLDSVQEISFYEAKTPSIKSMDKPVSILKLNSKYTATV